ncbi:hypothetical protein BM536_038745, partial [Streptomyces phaeoluteigriseus]
DDVPAPAPAPASGAAPLSVLEGVRAAWRAVLEHDGFGADHNFFDAGGHSLLLVKLREQLRLATGADVPVIDLLRHVTVQDQARLIAMVHRPADGTVPATPRHGHPPADHHPQAAGAHRAGPRPRARRRASPPPRPVRRHRRGAGRRPGTAGRVPGGDAGRGARGRRAHPGPGP